jgi:hypothetical protein
VQGGIESLTYELAVLYGPKGIRVVAVNPGNIETNLSNDYKDEKGNIDTLAKVTTTNGRGYGPLEKDFENLVRIPSGKKGSNFPDLHRMVMTLRGWLRGMHHHVWHLQDYLDEYCYRFNRSSMKAGIFDSLMLRMVKAPPCYIKNISS